MKYDKVLYGLFKLIALILICLIYGGIQYSTDASADTALFSDSGQNLGNAFSFDVALADLDSDGDLDAFVVNRDSTRPNKIWLNDGNGIFTDSGQNLGNLRSAAVSLGDVDSDGDLDAFVANDNFPTGEVNKVYFNDGNGIFTDSGQSLGNLSSIGVDLADIDNDGDLDAFVTNYGQPNKVWLNDGNGTFVDSGQVLGNGFSYRLDIGDLDGDGDLDAFVGNYNHPSGQANKVWLNDGNGIFSDSGQNLGSATSIDMALGDVDGDGDLDAVIANNQPPSKVWLNDGTGTFVDSGQNLSSQPVAGMALGDVDNDGDLDVFMGVNNGGKIWLNDGSGTYSDSGLNLGGSAERYGVAFGDVDNDSDQDIFTANFGQPNKLWRNDLDPAPLTVTATNPTGNGQAVALDTLVSATFSRDIDSNTINTQTFNIYGQQTGVYQGVYNGNPTVQFDATTDYKPGEVVFVNLSNSIKAADGVPLIPYAWRFRTSVTTGSGTFIDSGQNLPSIFSSGVVLADLDSDGDLDAFVGVNGANPDKVWFNDGTGNFVDSGQSLSNTQSQEVEIGDLDGDGDLDILVASLGLGNKVWLNDGSGFFSLHQNFGGPSLSAAIGDLDGDGDLDAYVGNNGGNQVWLNDGNGTFSDTGQVLGTWETRGVVVGDVDSDGDLDAATANFFGQENRLWLNDGSGNFTNSGLSLGGLYGQDIEIGDLDGDADLDVVVVNDLDQPNRAWVNDGSGIFSVSSHLGNSRSIGLTLGDVDGDGDLDAFITNVNPFGNEVWINDGAGAFSDSGQSLGDPTSQSIDADLGDVDGDGDLDAFVANTAGPNKIWLNALPNNPPTVDAGGPFIVDEGGTVSVSATGSDPDNDPLTFLWDLDNDGSFETAGQSVVFSAANFDGPSNQTIAVQATDTGGLSAVDQATIAVQNVAPTITSVVNDGPINDSGSVTITVTADDPAGALDPLTYEFDCDNDTVFEVGSQTTQTASCSFSQTGSYIVNARVTDDDGSNATGSTTVVVRPSLLTVTADSFLRSGNKNTNEGANLNMVVRASGKNRTLVSFDLTELSAVSSSINTATLHLYIVHNANNWGSEGRTIDAHQVTDLWSEGDGANFQPGNLTNSEFNPFKNRGNGSGVTWKCAVDTEINNQATDCNLAWNGGTFNTTPTDSLIIFKDFGGNNNLPPTIKTVGWVAFDVTLDVNACLAESAQTCSWLIKKTLEGQNGRIEFASKEGAAALYDNAFGEAVTPWLELTYPE